MTGEPSLRKRALARLTAVAALCAAHLCAWAAGPVEVNQATLAQLEAVKGIGPDLAEAILAERDRSPFVDWTDLARRVRGIGSTSAARLSAAGLTVNGAALPAAGPKRAASAPPGTSP